MREPAAERPRAGASEREPVAGRSEPGAAASAQGRAEGRQAERRERTARRFPPWRPGRALAEIHHRLRTEGDSPAAKAWSVAIGVLIGCLPLFGLHLPLCIGAAWLFRLNRVRTYLAANISNPLSAPVLLYVEIALGRWLSGGDWPAPTPEDIAGATGWSWSVQGRELAIGSVVLGVILGATLGFGAWLVARRWRRPPLELALVEAAGHRYLDAGVFAWETARGKLRRDPIYLALLRGGDLPRRGRLIDLGCGRGIALAMLATAAEQARAGSWPEDWPPPPEGLELLGLERSAKRVRTARMALGTDGEILRGDLAGGGPFAFELASADPTGTALPACDAVLLLDVLHYLDAAAQESLAERVAGALAPGGVLLIREADAAGGLRFALTRAQERICALARGHWRQRFRYRTASEWERLLAAHGLDASTRPMGHGTPFANVLVVGRKAKPSAPRATAL